MDGLQRDLDFQHKENGGDHNEYNGGEQHGGFPDLQVEARKMLENRHQNENAEVVTARIAFFNRWLRS